MRKRGFTLVEGIVVVVVIALLLALTLPIVLKRIRAQATENLIVATENWDVEEARSAIRRGADVNVRVALVNSTRTFITESGSQSVAITRITKGGLISLLHCALRSEDLELAQLLIDNDAEVDMGVESGHSPIRMNLHKPDAIRLLARSGADLDQLSPNGKTLLSETVWSEDSLRALLEVGAKPEITSGEKLTAHTLPWFRLDAVRTLLQYCEPIDFDALDRDGNTVLHNLVARGGALVAVEFLLSRGVNVNAINSKTGETPLDTLRRTQSSGFRPVEEVLIKAGAKTAAALNDEAEQ